MAGRRSAAALRVIQEARPAERQEPQYADPGEVAEFAQGLPEKFLLCRDMGHNWRPYTSGRFRDGGYERILRCVRCKTQRHQNLDSRGNPLSSKYVHPEGYLNKGLGRIVGEGRGILRLESIKRDLSKGA